MPKELPKDKETQEIIAHLESIQKGRMDAYNNREFGDDSFFFKHLHADFTVADPGGGKFTSGAPPRITQKQLVERMRLEPLSYVSRIVEMSTIVDRSKNFATTWTTTESRRGDGLAHSSVQVTRFEFIREEWLIVGQDWMYGGSSPLS